MKRGCLLSLAFYAALIAVYVWFLRNTLDSMPLYVTSSIAALLTLTGMGALRNAWVAGSEAALVRNSDWSIMPRDGARAAISGTLEPLESLLTAPMSGRPCVVYHYEVVRYKESPKSSEDNTPQKVVDFSGLAMIPCAVRGDSRTVELHGFPDLESVPADTLTEYTSTLRMRRFILQTEWKDCTGMRMFSGLGDFLSTLSDPQRSIRRDWRFVKQADCPWLDPARFHDDGAPIPANDVEFEEQLDEDEDEDEEDDLDDEDLDDEHEEVPPHASAEGDSYFPSLYEKRLEAGRPVTVLGYYDASRNGLISKMGAAGRPLMLYRDERAVVEKNLRKQRSQNFWGGLIGLIAIHAVLALGLFIYRHSDDTQRKWREELYSALEKQDAASVKKWLDRGVDPNRRDSGNETALFKAGDAASVKLLVERGANINEAGGPNGETPLMNAAKHGRVESLQALLAAGADLNRKSVEYGMTALMYADDNNQHECAKLLRAAGALDDVITAENGTPITEAEEPYLVCVEYIAALHARNGEQLHALSSRERKADFKDVDWKLWDDTRPQEPTLVKGYVRDDMATVTVAGPTPKGFNAPWVFSLRREEGAWRIARERWVP